MASNVAAWITAPKARPLEIKPSNLGVPQANQILVKNHAVAINPIDGKLQSFAVYPINYPAILGQDVAGVVTAVGPDVTRFKVGDRVIGTASGFGTKRDEDKAFQQSTILETNMAAEIPDDLSFERAVVLPLGVTTAASGLFHPDFLNLQPPTEPAQRSTGKVVIVWGGSSSVGSCAIQLATAAGYDVITTASKQNFDYVKELGAKETFDYNSSTVVQDMTSWLDGKTVEGAFDAVGGSAWALISEVVQKTTGTKFVATAAPRFPEPPEGISMKQVYSLSIKDNNVGKAVWEDFLPAAIRAGTFKAAPEPLVAGKGLEYIQDGIDLLSKGVSARKVVVLL